MPSRIATGKHIAELYIMKAASRECFTFFLCFILGHELRFKSHSQLPGRKSNLPEQSTEETNPIQRLLEAKSNLSKAEQTGYW